jgi:glycosyltransferase involved in cell wall biosynthesis
MNGPEHSQRPTPTLSMRLLIISHTPHYLREGEIVGWGATIREIDHLATLFESVVHIAPLHGEPAPASAMAYESDRVRLHAVLPTGGERLRDKVGIALRYPGYAWALLQESRSTDVIHIRAPANISLLSLVLLAFLRRPELRWAKYAGDWSRSGGEPWSYRFQRWWLARGLHRGLVTVNGRFTDQPKHIRSFLNPCLTDEELIDGAKAGERKELREPLRLLFVGRIESAKGVDICLEVMQQLKEAGVVAWLDLVGEGGETPQFEQRARDLGVASRLKFHGGQPREALGQFYEAAHFILLPSESEGWPKVLSEAMAYGVVPIATAVGSIEQHLADFSTGRAIGSRNSAQFKQVIDDYLRSPAHWREHSRNAAEAARKFSYANYLRAVRALLELPVAVEQASV